MTNNFISEAYKPAEKLLFNYFVIRDLLSRLLREQKFPLDLDSMILKVYETFQRDASHVIELYNGLDGVLNLDRLLEDIEDEVDSVFVNSGFDEPLMNDGTEAVSALVRFIADLTTSYLSGIEEHSGAIPGFNWDVSSFREAFNQIEKKGLDYVRENEHVGSTEERI